MRHGESESQLRKLITKAPGKYHLTTQGLKQAELLAHELSKVHIDQLYTSPLLRTMETAEIIARRMQLSPIVEDLLLERDNGKANGRIVANFSDEAKLYLSVRRYSIEPFPCLVERVVRFMRMVPFGTSVAVTHQDIIRAAAAHILGFGRDEFSSYGMMPGNGTITVVTKSRKGFQLLAIGAPYLARTMLDGG